MKPLEYRPRGPTLAEQFLAQIPDLSGRNTMQQPVFDSVTQALGAWWIREWPEAVLDTDALIRLDNMLKEEVQPDPLINEMREALQWCSGSADFAPDGQARQGWLKIQHLLYSGVSA